MKCNRCGKEINEQDMFCNDCKKYLKRVSSRSDVKEFEELIEQQKNLTDLENTKELVNLDKLVEEELEKQEVEVEKVQEKTQIFEMDKEGKETKQEEKKEEILKELPKKEKKKKKKLIIIVSIVLSVLIIISVLLIIILNKNKSSEEKDIVIDYKKVINTYGDYITDIVKDYIDENKDIPTWQSIVEKLDYDRYEVECSNYNIYNDGSIYLSDCKVNDKQTKYTYGEEKEEIKDGKKISIYKENYDGFLQYSNSSSSTSTLVGTITCKTENCEYVNSFEKYVLIKEDNEYYLYDYTTDSINFGPFLLNNEYDILVYNNILYGIFYKEENKNNIYNVKTGKILKDIKGYLLPNEMDFDPAIMYTYNYVILVNNGNNDFINLKTGNVSYTIKENIESFIESSTKKIVYITTTTSNNKLKIYNSNGKSLFEGKEYSYFIIGNNNLLVATEINFKVYDNDLKLKTTSKEYDQILGIYEEFVVAAQDTNLILLSIDDKVLATFENAWDKNNTKFYNNLSNKNNDRITLVVENKKIPYGTQGNSIEYYYILSTGISGFNEKTGIE